MSMAQFDALLAILETHIKKKTTNFCELSVQGSLHCFVLRDEVNELDCTVNEFCLYGGSELSKHLSKCLLRMRKIEKIEPDPNYDRWKFRRQCVNVIDITWGRMYFLTCENFGQHFRTFTAFLKAFSDSLPIPQCTAQALSLASIGINQKSQIYPCQW